MKYAKLLLLSLALIVYTVPAFAKEHDKANEAADAQDRLDSAARKLDSLVNAGDKGVPQSILADAKCVAIVPKLMKGGFIFGAEHGRGVATCRNGNRWSAPAFFTMTGGNWGAQIGVEGVELVMFFMDRRGAEQLMSANWKIGADAGLAAGPFGRQVAAGTSWKLNTGILVYSKAKGAFIGIDLSGTNVRADQDANTAFYGKEHNFRQILNGQVKAPQRAQPFMAEIHRDFHEAEANK